MTLKQWIKTRIIKLFTIVGLSSFQTIDSSYRVTGYYYIYKPVDGDRRLIPCPKLFANTIGGYGVCGNYIPFHEVTGLGFSFKRWFFFKRSLKRWKRYKYEWSKFIFFITLPKNATEKMILDKAIDSAMKTFKNK